MVRRSRQRKYRARETNNSVRRLIETEKEKGEKEGGAIKAAKKERERKKARIRRTIKDYEDEVKL